MPITAKDIDRIVSDYQKYARVKKTSAARTRAAAEAAKKEAERIRAEKELLGR